MLVEICFMVIYSINNFLACSIYVAYLYHSNTDFISFSSIFNNYEKYIDVVVLVAIIPTAYFQYVFCLLVTCEYIFFNNKIMAVP